MPAAEAGTRRLRPLLIIVALGMILSGAAFIVAKRSDDRRVQSDLESRTLDHAHAFERRMVVTMDSLEALAFFVSGEDQIDSAKFHKFARLDHDGDDVNSALQWAPLVRGPDRQAFVDTARTQGAPDDFEIKERAADGTFVVASGRDEYLPALFDQAYDGNFGIPGFDLLSLPERRVRAERARDEGKPIATPPVAVYSGATQELGFLVFWPIYSTGEVPETREERRSAYRGAVVSRLGFSEVLPALIASSPGIEEGVEFFIDRGREGGPPVQVGAYDPRTGKVALGETSAGRAAGGLTVARGFESFGRHWAIRFHFSPEVVARASSNGPWAWLVLGLALTGFTAAYFDRERSRRRVIEETVAGRTAELSSEVARRRQQERIAREQALATSEVASRLQAVIDTTVHGVVIIGADGTITMFNPAAERLFGYSAVEVEGRNIKMLMPSPFQEEHDGYLDNYRRTGERRIIGIGREVVGRRKDGSTFPMDLAVGEARQGGAPIFVGVIVDLTERKTAEAALRLWSDAFDKAAFGIGIVDPVTNTIRVANGAMAKIHGMTIDEMPGLSIYAGYPAEEIDRLALMATTLERTGHVAFEAFRLRKDGSQFPVQADITDVRDGVGKSLYRIVSAFDITERRKAEDQLRQSQKMEAIGNLTGGMAHDFNNLLGIVIGNLDLLRPVQAPHGEGVELVDDALEAALRGADLTRRLLAFARRQPLAPRRVALNELVVNIVKLLQRTLGEQIEIALDLAGSVWPVVVDPAQLEAAITNLATNARDAMPGGGSLIIATANRRLDDDYAGVHPEVVAGDYALIEASDSGTGMTTQVMERIFEPFYTTKAEGKGTGLGLSMVFGFMKQSGGHINVYSELGVGTTFRLYLPRAADGTVEEAETEDVVAPRARGNETILAVEDNAALRRVVVRQLTAMGYRVIEADSAATALAALEQGQIDLVLSDVVMPGGLDGYALSQRVMTQWPSVKVVLTSGFPQAHANGTTEALARSLELLVKPYRKDELARAIRDALDR